MTDDLFSAVVGPISKHPLYRVLMGMRTRCHNPKYRDFKHYGGRGIVVCGEWRKSSRAFISWALANGWRPGLEIDRLDNDGDYCPENCRFVTRKENMRNTRRTVVTDDGHVLAELLDGAAVEREMAMQRYRDGWAIEDCLAAPAWIGAATRDGLEYELTFARKSRNGARCELLQGILDRLGPERR